MSDPSERAIQCSLELPLHVQSTVRVPAAIPSPWVVRHLPSTCSAPSAVTVMFCAAVPLQEWMSITFPSEVPDCQSSTQELSTISGCGAQPVKMTAQAGPYSAWTGPVAVG